MEIKRAKQLITELADYKMKRVSDGINRPYPTPLFDKKFSFKLSKKEKLLFRFPLFIYLSIILLALLFVLAFWFDNSLSLNTWIQINSLFDFVSHIEPNWLTTYKSNAIAFVSAQSNYSNSVNLYSLLSLANLFLILTYILIALIIAMMVMPQFKSFRVVIALYIEVFDTNKPKPFLFIMALLAIAILHLLVSLSSNLPYDDMAFHQFFLFAIVFCISNLFLYIFLIFSYIREIKFMKLIKPHLKQERKRLELHKAIVGQPTFTKNKLFNFGNKYFDSNRL